MRYNFSKLSKKQLLRLGWWYYGDKDHYLDDFARSTSTFILMNSDSILSQLSDQNTNETNFKNDLASYNVNIDDVVDASQGGTTLTYQAGGPGELSFWDERTDMKGDKYVDIIDQLDDKQNYTDIVVSFGTNDAASVYEANFTAQDYADVLSSYIDQLKQDFTNVKNVFIFPIARHSYSDNELAFQLIREAQLILVNSRLDCHMTAEWYDLALADNVHPNTGSYVEISKRIASRVGYINEKHDKISLGMTLQSAVMDDEGCLVTVSHTDGNDITVPSGASLDPFRAETNGDFVDIDTGHSLEKVSANQFRIKGAPWTEPTLTPVWGTMYNMVATQTTPDVIRDNSELALPIQFSDAITPTDSDIIRNIKSLAYHVRASYPKTYDSGTDIAAIQSVNGKTFSNLNAGEFMTYDATAFDGAGGIVNKNTNSLLSCDDGLAAQETMMIGFNLNVPASLGGNRLIFGFASSNTTSTRAQIYITATGELRYSRDQDAGQEILGGAYLGQRIAVILNFTSFDNCDVYVNDSVSPLASFDPDNVYAFLNDISFGGGEAGMTFHEWFVKLGDHDSANDPSLEDIMSAMKNNANIS